MKKENKYGQQLRERVNQGKILSMIGVYDAFSSLLAADKFDAIFCSGYGFSASYYGLPDEGFITWTDMVAYVQRVRAILKDTHIIVDIDDGYGDHTIAEIVTRRLEQVGASGIILEDQRRPKKCGHLKGKEILPIDEYKKRLQAVIDTKNDIFVIARTDSDDFEDAIKRVNDYSSMGADAILIEGLKSHEQITTIRKKIPTDAKLVVNLIAGGKTKPIDLSELSDSGVNIVNYSTPCLFATHRAIRESLDDLLKNNGKLSSSDKDVTLDDNNSFLKKSSE